MHVDDLCSLLEQHAKAKLAGEFSGYLEGKRHALRVEQVRPHFPDRDDFGSEEEYQESLAEAEELARSLEEDPQLRLIVSVINQFPGHPRPCAVTGYTMALSEAQQYGEHLVEVASLRLLDALDNLKALEPV